MMSCWLFLKKTKKKKKPSQKRKKKIKEASPYNPCRGDWRWKNHYRTTSRRRRGFFSSFSSTWIPCVINPVSRLGMRTLLLLVVVPGSLDPPTDRQTDIHGKEQQQQCLQLRQNGLLGWWSTSTSAMELRRRRRREKTAHRFNSNKSWERETKFFSYLSFTLSVIVIGQSLVILIIIILMVDPWPWKCKKQRHIHKGERWIEEHKRRERDTMMMRNKFLSQEHTCIDMWTWEIYVLDTLAPSKGGWREDWVCLCHRMILRFILSLCVLARWMMMMNM